MIKTDQSIEKVCIHIYKKKKVDTIYFFAKHFMPNFDSLCNIWKSSSCLWVYASL